MPSLIPGVAFQFRLTQTENYFPGISAFPNTKTNIPGTKIFTPSAPKISNSSNDLIPVFLLTTHRLLSCTNSSHKQINSHFYVSIEILSLKTTSVNLREGRPQSYREATPFAYFHRYYLVKEANCIPLSHVRNTQDIPHFFSVRITPLLKTPI